MCQSFPERVKDLILEAIWVTNCVAPEKFKLWSFSRRVFYLLKNTTNINSFPPKNMKQPSSYGDLYFFNAFG